jgi:hypothetical protein
VQGVEAIFRSVGAQVQLACAFLACTPIKTGGSTSRRAERR